MQVLLWVLWQCHGMGCRELGPQGRPLRSRLSELDRSEGVQAYSGEELRESIMRGLGQCPDQDGPRVRMHSAHCQLWLSGSIRAGTPSILFSHMTPHRAWRVVGVQKPFAACALMVVLRGPGS